MADRNRRFRLAAIALPLLLLAISGMARAATITVNTLDGGSDAAPLCTLEDAVEAANTQAVVNGCAAGSGNDTIVFAVSGTISIQFGLAPAGTLSIIGPVGGGITISGAAAPFGITGIISVDQTNLTLKNLTLADATNLFGGAIYADFADLEIENCTFVGNTAAAPSPGGGPGLGGAIFLGGGTATIINSTFADNTAQSDSIGDMTFPGAGGAIDNDNGTLTITNSTFSGNSADFGAAIFGGGPLTSLRGVILANSTGGQNCDGSITNDGFNLDDGTSCGFAATNGSLSNTNPLLLALANNGGPTQTFALETSPTMSPAIGLDTDCTDQAMTPNPVLTDQRLFIRPDSPTKCDSGAYEHDGVPPIAVVPNTERLQIARSTTPNSDQVNLALSFTERMIGTDCMGEDALNDGLVVQLYEGTCADMTSGPLFVNLNPFVVHTVNHVSYGTLFQSIAPETVSARMALLGMPANTCGEWSLNLEVSGLDTVALGLGGTNPFALVLTDASGIASGCIDIDNAIVGNQIDPPTHSARREVRRQRRRGRR
jgi:hypothetical protein